MPIRVKKAQHYFPMGNAFVFRAGHCRAECLGAAASDGVATYSRINGHRASTGME